MSSPSRPDTGAGKALSRRSVLTGLAATCVAASAKWSWAAGSGDGPSFSASGPDAELYGAAENYPIKDRWRIYQPGNPASPKYRVGAFSHYDEIFPTRHVDRSARAPPVHLRVLFGNLQRALRKQGSQPPSRSFEVMPLT